MPLQCWHTRITTDKWNAKLKRFSIFEAASSNRSHLHSLAKKESVFCLCPLQRIFNTVIFEKRWRDGHIKHKICALVLKKWCHKHYRWRTPSLPARANRNHPWPKARASIGSGPHPSFAWSYLSYSCPWGLILSSFLCPHVGVMICGYTDPYELFAAVGSSGSKAPTKTTAVTTSHC